MGYRLYLATVDKKVAEDFGTISNADFLDKYGKDYGDGEIEPPSPYDFPTHEKVFELGKYVDEDFTSALTGKEPQPLFGDADLNDRYEEEYIHRIGKDNLLALIECHRERIAQSYKDMLEWKEEDKYRYYEGADLAFKQKRFFESRQENWEGNFVDFLDTDDDNKHTLSHFWDYEYQIFNLIHILKTLDWENKQLILYGY